MRYPCNLYGQPASPWLFWGKEPPNHPHPTYLLRPWLNSAAKGEQQAQGQPIVHRGYAGWRPDARRSSRRQ
jgi:hypothetical protein